MTITEAGCMGVKPGLDIMDESTPEGKILKTTWETVTTKPGGPHRVCWGLEREDPSKVWAWFDWDSVEHHQEFAQTHAIEAVKDLPKICTHGILNKHVTITPSSDIFKSPLTEIVFVYFPADISPGDMEVRASQLQEILIEGFGESTGVQGLGHGRGKETDFPVRGSDDLKGSALVGFIEWSGTDDQEKHSKTDTYAQAMEKIRGLAESIGFSAFTMASRSIDRAA